MIKKNYLIATISALAFMVVIAVLGLKAYEALAVTATNVGSPVMRTTKYTVSYTDIKNGTDVSAEFGNVPPGSFRRVTIVTLLGGQQIVSWVTNVKSGFVLPTGSSVGILASQAQRNGVTVNAGDFTYPATVSAEATGTFWNQLGNGLEYMFYDETLSTDMTIVFYTPSGENLNTLTGGEIEFYVLRTQ